MSTLDLTGRVDLGALLLKLAALGATVTWPGESPAASTVVTLDVGVDADAAWDAMPSHYAEEDMWGEHSFDPDPRDVRDFVGACLGGDRALAGALLSRVCASVGAQAAAEHALRIGGRA